MSDRAKSRMGGSKSKPKSSKGKPHHISIHHAANGGFVVKHHPDPTSQEAPEDNIVQDMPQLQQHVADSMAQPGAAPAPPPQGAPAPQPGM